MSSPLATSSSSTQDSDISYQDFSELDVLNNIKTLKSLGIHYAAIKDLSSQCQFIFNNSLKGDILVEKDSEKEFIFVGVFEIDSRNFFMTSDGRWNSNNNLNTHFYQTKPTCLLLPPQRPTDIIFSKYDYPTIITNLRAIENLANPLKTPDVHSLIVDEAGKPPAIRLTHHLFIVCLLKCFFFASFKSDILFFTIHTKKKGKNKNPDLKKNGISSKPAFNHIIIFDSNTLEYNMNNWPVSPANETYLNEIKASHDVQQLDAYDVNNNIISPFDYEEKLAGAIARICFSIIHFSIKEKHVFSTRVKDITVLRPPILFPNTSLRHVLHPNQKPKTEQS